MNDHQTDNETPMEGQQGWPAACLGAHAGDFDLPADGRMFATSKGLPDGVIDSLFLAMKRDASRTFVNNWQGLWRTTVEQELSRWMSMQKPVLQGMDSAVKADSSIPTRSSPPDQLDGTMHHILHEAREIVDALEGFDARLRAIIERVLGTEAAPNMPRRPRPETSGMADAILDQMRAADTELDSIHACVEALENL